jgi:hypothetical protein
MFTVAPGKILADRLLRCGRSGLGKPPGANSGGQQNETEAIFGVFHPTFLTPPPGGIKSKLRGAAIRVHPCFVLFSMEDVIPCHIRLIKNSLI